jgi:4-carboxymuconolactone decarboxylase
MKHKSYSFLTFLVLMLCFPGMMNAQNNTIKSEVLDSRQQHIVMISSFTAMGDLVQLQKALSNGLDAGLTVNEIKEVLVHLYAYCGFPRSLQGINTFIALLDIRKAKGINDKVGREATSVKNNLSKYEQGKKALETLTGRPEIDPKVGYAAFAPVIDTFLKEHLFADIFGRDVLSNTDREIATISALICLGGVEPMMQGHIRIALHLGMSEAELSAMLSLIGAKVGKEEADAGRQVLSTLTKSAVVQNSGDTTISSNNILAKGVKAPAHNFTGIVWVNMVVQAQDGLDCSVGVVTFEVGARTNWHSHPGGQLLLVTEGKGLYQERGKLVRVIQKGEVVKCPPGVAHWHGASPDTKLTHIAIAPNAEKGAALWLQRVTDEEYKSFK